MADDANAGVLLADGANGLGVACPLDESGLACASDSDACAVADGNGWFADTWALALTVSANRVVITQGHLVITHPRLTFQRALSKVSETVWVPVATIDLAREGHPRCVLIWLKHWV